jgi:16S rRNA (guanine527-N7)-methyltransferase
VSRRKPEGARASGAPAAAGSRIREALGRIGFHATPAQLEAFDLYLRELLRWTRRVNLTGFRTEEAIVREGFARSLLYAAGFTPAPGLKAVDIGSGAGFPGLVLKIGYPELDMLLVEPARRRASFLRSLLRQLRLPGVQCVQARGEQLRAESGHRARYAVAFARAVGPLPDVVETVAPLLAPGGRLVLQPGRRAIEALDLLTPLLAEAGLAVATVALPPLAPHEQPACLLVIEKARKGGPRPCFT